MDLKCFSPIKGLELLVFGKIKKKTFNSGLIFGVLKHQRHVFRNLWNRSFDSNETHIFVYYAT